MRILLTIACWTITWSAATAAPVRQERLSVAGGAELVTWFERLPDGSELPILSALDDKLSATDAERLRQVWVHTYAPPSLRQRAEGAVPFLYHRIWSDAGERKTPPRPILDMGSPSKGLWQRVAMSVVQAEVIHPAGALARLTTRSYGANLGEYKTTHVWEALDIIQPASQRGPGDAQINGELPLLESRLELIGHLFSGLVSDEALPGFYEKYQTEQTETRGHNWEILRQAAEENALNFEPLIIGGVKNAFAMVSISRDDLRCDASPHPGAFDAQFLKIGNPFTDEHLCKWTGYASGDVIPLAVYSLDYAGVPLLLVDFRRVAGPTRSEMTLRAADEVTTGVLGLSGFGFSHLGYRAIKSSWLFVHGRHGSATNRAMRRRAFVQLRHALGVDEGLDPELRAQLAKRVEMLDIDPLERSWQQEVAGARAQYAALVKSARNPRGLARLVRHDREQEALAMAHGPGARVLLRAAAISSFGLYRHDDTLTPGKLEQLAQKRRETLAARHAALPEPGDIQAGE